MNYVRFAVSSAVLKSSVMAGVTSSVAFCAISIMDILNIQFKYTLYVDNFLFTCVVLVL